MPTYRPHSTAGDMGELVDGRQGLVTARVETNDGPLAALLDVLIVPSSPCIPD